MYHSRRRTWQGKIRAIDTPAPSDELPEKTGHLHRRNKWFPRQAAGLYRITLLSFMQAVALHSAAWTCRFLDQAGLGLPERVCSDTRVTPKGFACFSDPNGSSGLVAWLDSRSRSNVCYRAAHEGLGKPLSRSRAQLCMLQSGTEGCSRRCLKGTERSPSSAYHSADTSPAVC